MSGLIPEAFIDDLLARTDIVEVIQQRLPLKRAGRDWTALCPFHDERSPSFTVSPAKQFYHCFGCGAHGSAIGFLMNYERLEFPDAVEELAGRLGIDVPREGGRGRERRFEETSGLYTLLESAACWYEEQLNASPQAQAYLAQRDIQPQTVARYRIGWAPPGWNGLRDALGSTPALLGLLDRGGMLARNERGSYDRFRARVMFPITDRRGRPIAFGGRVIDPEASPKYLNSPETPLFHKGRELFGLWQVRQAHPKIPRLVVVEGYMDVIALDQAGIQEAVATLGTATTPDHAELLFRQCQDVVFCFDGDRAGRQAAWRAVESVLPRMRDGRHASFLFLPEGEDPDSLVRSEGEAGFLERLAAATPLSEVLFAEAAGDANLETLDGRARFAERLRPLVARVPDGAYRDLLQAELDRRTGVQVAVPAPPTTPPAAPAKTPAARRTVVRVAITLLVQYPELAEGLAPPWAFAGLQQQGVPLLIELLELIHARPGIRPGPLLDHFAGREEEAALRRLSVAEFLIDDKAAQAEFEGALAQLARQAQAERREALLEIQRMRPLDDAEKDELRELLRARIAGD